jgi:hypothetical protein
VRTIPKWNATSPMAFISKESEKAATRNPSLSVSQFNRINHDSPLAIALLILDFERAQLEKRGKSIPTTSIKTNFYFPEIVSRMRTLLVVKYSPWKEFLVVETSVGRSTEQHDSNIRKHLQFNRVNNAPQRVKMG